MIDCKPRTYSGNCAGRTAASSMNATGFAGPMHPVKSDRPDLRTDQTRFICAGSVRIFVRSPIFLRLQDRQPFRDVFVELDDQNRFARFRVQFEQIARGLKLKLTFGLIEQRTIDVFDRGGSRSRSSTVACIASVDRREEDQAQTFLARQRRDLQFGGENRGERSFAAGENVREIVRRAQESFDAVTGPAL